jgi:hypothetical protein
MGFLRVLIVLLLLSLTSISCSTSTDTTDSGADLLNQAMTPVKSSRAPPPTVAVDQKANAGLMKNQDMVSGGGIKLSHESATIIPLQQNFAVTNLVVTKSVPPEAVALPKILPASASKKKAIIKSWKVLLSDKVISNTLERWAEQGGYQLVWKSNHDFEITSSAIITGTIRDAFNQVLLSFVDSNSPIKATWYKNKVIVITSFNE